MKSDFDYTTETLLLPYRKPVWQGPGKMAFQPAEMAVHRVRVLLGGGGSSYSASQALAAEFGVPPEFVRTRLWPDANVPTEGEQVLVVATEPGPFVAQEAAVRHLLETGVPSGAYTDAWELYEECVYDENPRNGWLLRLKDAPVDEPVIDVTGDGGVIAAAEEYELGLAAGGGRTLMGEGDYLFAKVRQYLELKSPGQRLPHDRDELLSLYLGIPYVQGVVEDFRAGRPLPGTWVRFNLAYAVRTGWFLQQELGWWWADRADVTDHAVAFECSLVGENNHL